jgi:hypothetical protein
MPDGIGPTQSQMKISENSVIKEIMDWFTTSNFKRGSSCNLIG